MQQAMDKVILVHGLMNQEFLRISRELRWL
jgi:hypothetical protein